MPSAKKEKPPTEIDLDVFEVNAIGDKKHQPFFNVFHFQGANYAEQKLGELFGVIQIFDDSKNSAYLPNVIAQVIKKEFFSDYRRPTEKAFESALHKANLALTDLAQHEIVEWIGRLHSVIGVLNKETFHFTQAGGGRILLIRNKLISDITRGLDDGEGIGHPIKTFSNISAGNVVCNDKLIFCTETVFDSFSWEDLKRHCNAFSPAEFDNLFRATLLSEAQQAGAIVVNVNEKAVQPVPAFNLDYTDEEKIPDQNFFGSTAHPRRNPASLLAPPHHQSSQSSDYSQTGQQQNVDANQELVKPISPQHRHAPSQEASQEKNTAKEYIHSKKENRDDVIYIKEAEEKQNDAEPTITIKNRLAEYSAAAAATWKEYWPLIRKKISRSGKKTWLLAKRAAAVLAESFQFVVRSLWKKYQAHRMNKEAVRQKESRSSLSQPDNRTTAHIPVALAASPGADKQGQPLMVAVISLMSRIPGALLKFIKSNPIANRQKNAVNAVKKNRPNIISAISGLSRRFIKLPKKYFLAAASLMVAIILIYTISARPTPSDEEVAGHTDSMPPSSIPTANADNSPAAQSQLNIQSLTTIDAPVVQIAGMKNDLFILAEEDSFYRFDLTDRKLSRIDLPADMRQIKTIARMNDLNLVFLISPNAVFSYSPVTNKFQTNNIELPAGLDVSKADCYMTYLYLLDNKSNQIFQYPRAQGGFGQKKDWLKKTLDDSSVTDLSIDGSLYISFGGGQVKKYFRGKEDPTFSFTGSDAIHPSYLVAERENDPAYLLDDRRAKLIETSREGAVTKEWSDARFEKAKDFWVDYDNKKIYLVDSNNSLLSFDL